MAKYTPVLSNIRYEDSRQQWEFTLEGVPLPFANGLRRCMVAHIPVVGFLIHLDTKQKWTNVTRFHNEFLEDRLMCIPIHTKDLKTLPEEWMLEIDVKNESDEIVYVTTEHFRLKRKTMAGTSSGDQYMDEAEVRKLFPPCEKTGQFIDFARLNAKIGALPVQRLAITAEFCVMTGDQNSSVSSGQIGMGNTPDPVAQTEAWNAKEAELKNDADLTADEIAIRKSDFGYLDAQRFFKKDSYDFVVRTVGVYTCEEIARLGCDVFRQMFVKWHQEFLSGSVLVIPAKSTMDHSWVIQIGGDSYTVGNVLEWMLYVTHYLPSDQDGKNATLTFCAFRKDHPHDDTGNLLLAFREPTDIVQLREMVAQTVMDAIGVLDLMCELFAGKQH